MRLKSGECRGSTEGEGAKKSDEDEDKEQAEYNDAEKRFESLINRDRGTIEGEGVEKSDEDEDKEQVEYNVVEKKSETLVNADSKQAVEGEEDGDNDEPTNVQLAWEMLELAKEANTKQVSDDNEETKDENGDSDQATEGEEDEDDDEPTNLRRAWEMFELAKEANTKQVYDCNVETKDKIERRLCNTLLIFGEISLENENYGQAEEDLFCCLKAEVKRILVDCRDIAETPCQRLTQCIYKPNPAITVHDTRVQNIKNEAEALDEATKKEIFEFQVLFPDISEKIPDTKEMKDEHRSEYADLFYRKKSPVAETIEDYYICVKVPEQHCGDMTTQQQCSQATEHMRVQQASFMSRLVEITPEVNSDILINHQYSFHTEKQFGKMSQVVLELYKVKFISQCTNRQLCWEDIYSNQKFAPKVLNFMKDKHKCMEVLSGEYSTEIETINQKVQTSDVVIIAKKENVWVVQTTTSYKTNMECRMKFNEVCEDQPGADVLRLGFEVIILSESIRGLRQDLIKKGALRKKLKNRKMQFYIVTECFNEN